MDRAARGLHAERLALAHLVERGLVLVARNYRCRLGEIDLVMRDGDDLVFVEVRYRSGARHGGAAASVDHRKRRRLCLTAEHYLTHGKYRRPPRCRFDVVAVSGTPDAPRVAWLRAAFEAQAD